MLCRTPAASGPLLVVAASPGFEDGRGFGHAGEDCHVQALVAQRSEVLSLTWEGVDPAATDEDLREAMTGHPLGEAMVGRETGAG